MKFIVLIFSVLCFFTLDAFAIGSSDRVIYVDQIDSENDSVVIDILKSLDITGTGYLKFPVGTDAQRPTALTGMSRWNTDQECLEIYNSTEWFCVGTGGGGGSAGINFVTDPSFENGELDPDTTAAGLESYELYTLNADLYSEFNLQHFQVDWASLSAADAYVRDSFARTGLEDKQGLFSIWIKSTTVSDQTLQLCLRVDDSDYSETCDDTYLVTIKSDDTWQKYEIPFVFGASSVEYEIFNESYTGALEINVDKIYVGTVPDGYFQSINNVDTDFITDGALTIEAVTTNPTKGTTTVDRVLYKRIGDSVLAKYEYYQSGAGSAGSGDYLFSLPNGLSFDSDKVSFYTGTIGDELSSVGFGTYSFGTEFVGIFAIPYDSTRFRIGYKFGTSTASYVSSAAGGLNGATRGYTINIQAPIQGWSTGRTNAFSQRTELCQLVASDNDGNLISGGTEDIPFKAVEFQKGDCIYDNSGNTGADTNDAFTASRDMVVNVDGMIQLSSATDFDLDYYVNGSQGKTCQRMESGGVSARFFGCTIPLNKDDVLTFRFVNGRTLGSSTIRHHIAIVEQARDVNVIGKFANINDTELCQVKAANNGSESITASTTNITFTEIKDNCNSWSGTEFTAPRTAVYSFDGSEIATVSSTRTVQAYVDSGSGYLSDTRCTQAANSTLQKFQCDVFLEEGWKLALRSDVSHTLNNTDLHKLNITELPDLSAIVENLSDNPRAARSDQYSESEIKWGMWNGQQLYRRCFTVASDITTTNTLITTWDSSLVPKGIPNYITTFWHFFRNVESSNSSLIEYNSSNGEIRAFIGGTHKIGAGTSYCMDYYR